MNFFKKHIKTPTIFIGVFFISLLLTICNFKFLLHAGGDHAIYINVSILWNLTKNTWDENTLFLLGGFSYANMSSLSYVFPFKILSFIPNLWRQYVFFALFFTFTFLFGYHYFRNYLFKKTFPALISAIFYLFNLYLFSCYVNIPNQFLIVVLPLLLILCHCIIDGNIKKILLFSLLSSLFIPGAFVNVPNGLPLLLLIFLYIIFLIVKENIFKKVKQVLNYSIVTLIVLLLLNSWWLLSMINSLFGYSILGSVKESTVEFFPTSSLHEAFRFLGGWSFNDYWNSPGAGLGRLLVTSPIFIFLSYLVIIIAFCSFVHIKREKTISFFILLAFLGLSLAKGILNPWGNVYSYVWKNIPGMFSFRTPHSKFMIIYLLPISCLLGYFADGVSRTFKKNMTRVINGILIFIIVIIALPFIFGGFLNRIDGGLSRSYLIKVPDYMWEYRKADYLDKLDYRFMVFPEANGSKAYNWEKGFNTVYSKMDFFSEKAIIQNNQYRFEKGDELAIDTYKNINYFNELLNDQKGKFNLREWKPALLLGILNVRYFIQENDLDWRYQSNNFSTRSPSEIKKMFDLLKDNNVVTKRAEFGKFDQEYLAKIPNRVTDNWLDGSVLSAEQKIYLKDILYKELKDRPALDLFNISKELYVPHIYVPEVNMITGGPIVKFYDSLELKDYSKSLGILFTEKNRNKNLATSLIKDLEIKGEKYMPKELAVEYRKIGATKYKVVLHNVNGVVPIIFSDAFDQGWKLYIKNAVGLKNNLLSANSSDSKLLEEYKILENNENDQATKEELASYIDRGWISTLGNSKSKSVKHYTFVQGAENIDYIEKINIDFISKNYKRTIQNDNLGKGSFWETWFPKNGNNVVKRSDLYMIEEPYHINMNGFVNGWVLDIDDLCRTGPSGGFCLENNNTFDLDMVLEFEPQKTFHFSVIISVMTILCLGIYFLIGHLKYFKADSHNE